MMTGTKSDEIQDLRARVANLEATLESLQQWRMDFSQTPLSRRSLLSFLAGAGAGVALEFAASANAAGPAGAVPGAWKSYVPQLMGEKVDPVLGDGRKGKRLGGPGFNGHYCQINRLVVVKTWNQFSIGAQPGEGQYRLTLPIPAATGSDAWWGPTGLAIMHRDKTNIIRNAAVILATSTFVTFQLDNTPGGLVTHDQPWLWAEGDGLNTFMIYEAKDGE